MRVVEAGVVVEENHNQVGAASRRVLTILGSSSAIMLAAVLVVSLRAQEGTFTYAIDDASIHLTIARNLAHGTFGIVPGQYQSASSAPLWVFLLAPVLRFAPGAWWAPLVLNVAALGWLLVSIARLPLLRRMANDPLGIVAVAALPVLLGSIPLAMTGMEHVLHAAILVQLLVWLGPQIRGTASRRSTIMWYGLIAAGSLLRFETMFVVIGLASALVLLGEPRRWRTAVESVVAAAAPVLVFAVINRGFGQYALPNSVVAKTSLGDGSLIPDPSDILERLTEDRLLVLLVVGASVLVVSQHRRSSRDSTTVGALVAMLVTTLLHVAFADVGWFDRYQAYLVAGLAFAVLSALALVQIPVRQGVLAMSALVIVLSMLRVDLLMSTTSAQYDIYQAQYQLGRFLDRAYDDRSIAVGDIGYVSWMHRGELVDLLGLGSFEVLSARKEHRFGAAFTEELLSDERVEVIAVYDNYFANGGSLAGWVEAGQWCFTDQRVVLSGGCIAFYAPDGAAAAYLRRELDRFAPELPAGVAPVPS